MIIRRARPDEGDLVRALVQRVVDETYGGLWVSVVNGSPIRRRDRGMAYRRLRQEAPRVGMTPFGGRGGLLGRCPEVLGTRCGDDDVAEPAGCSDDLRTVRAVSERLERAVESVFGR